MKNEELKKELKKMKSEIERKKEELETLLKKVEELNDKLQVNYEKRKETDLKDTIKEASDLLNFSLNLLGTQPMASKGEGKSGLSGLVDSIARLAERSETFQRDFEIAGKRGVVDLRVSSRPIREAFPSHGRISHGKTMRGTRGDRELRFADVRDTKGEGEPIVDIVETDDTITVLVDLPGLEEKDIQWNVEGNRLIMNAVSPDKKYTKDMILSSEVEQNGSESKYQNGIFRIKLKKKK